MTETAEEFEVMPIGQVGFHQVSIPAGAIPAVILYDSLTKQEFIYFRIEARKLAALLLEAAQRLEEER